MAGEIQRFDPGDPRERAYQLGTELARYIADLVEPSEQIERQTANRRVHYRDGEVELVEETVINERITRRG
ncbi:hypothetical protein ACFZAD_24690 [Streptomyces iakyrus]|uniref:hypothetical protein n=1 Tax=Streptomyces iakyrus TaxID=68219 RepID=UPI0036F0FCA6